MGVHVSVLREHRINDDFDPPHWMSAGWVAMDGGQVQPLRAFMSVVHTLIWGCGCAIGDDYDMNRG